MELLTVDLASKLGLSERRKGPAVLQANVAKRRKCNPMNARPQAALNLYR